jgi:phosphatidylglycerophosphate synthase
MRKIPSRLECPIDNIIIGYLSEPLSIILRHHNFTPNGITTLSLFWGAMSVAAMYYSWVLSGVIFMALSYIMDCVDGYYARKYDMVTMFGDYYDHSKDIVVFLIYSYVIYHRNCTKLSVWEWEIYATILLLFLSASTFYIACQEAYYGRHNETPSLRIITKWVSSQKQAEKYLRIWRFFGSGTFMSVVLILTLWIELCSG